MLYKCDKCCRKFKFRKYLNKHIKENHEETAPLHSCDVKHISMISKDDNRNIVETVPRDFKVKNDKIYSNKDTSENKLVCGKMKIIGINIKEENPEQGIKTRLRNYQCDKEELPKDLKKRKKSFVCDFCGRSFISNYRLQKHFRVSHKHENNKAKKESALQVSSDQEELSIKKAKPKKMLQCQFCKKQFLKKFALKYHIDKLHQHCKSSPIHKKSLVNVEVYSHCNVNSKHLSITDAEEHSNKESSKDCSSDTSEKDVKFETSTAKMTQLKKELFLKNGLFSYKRNRKTRKCKRIIWNVVKENKIVETPDELIIDTICSFLNLNPTPDRDDDTSIITTILLMKKLPQTQEDKILKAPILHVEKLNDFKIRVVFEAGIDINQYAHIEIYMTIINSEAEWVRIGTINVHKPYLIIHVIRTTKKRYFFSARCVGYNGCYTIFSIPETWHN